MESKEGADALFLYATEGILVTNDRGEIVRANDSAARLFGYEKDELTGQRIELLVPARFGNAHQKHRQEYAHNPHARAMGLGLDLYGLRKDGSEFPLEISLSPYKNSTGSFVIAFIVDTTIRKQAEEKLKNYSKELEQQVKDRTLVFREAIEELQKTKAELYDALEKERELNEMKSRFVSMASHEFRTPLTTMLSSLSLISVYHERGDGANVSRHITKVEGSIAALTEMLNDFLSVSRLEEGGVTSMPQELDIQQFVKEVVSEIQPMASEKHLLLCRHTGDPYVKLDPKLLKNVLLNLVSNAIKFSPDGGRITVESVVNENGLRLTVSDEGIGISTADQAHLFERFFRGCNATHIQGTGLGLNIVGSYVELMKGRVELRSREKEGTSIAVIFPANAVK